MKELETSNPKKVVEPNDKIDVNELKDEKDKVLNKVFDDIQDKYGENIVFDPARKIEVLPTGSIGLDMAIGVGGWPRGRIIDLYGKESSGKSLLALLAIAQVQKLGGYSVIIDAEHAFYSKWAHTHHVDTTKNLKVFQPESGEQAFNIAEQVIRSGAVDLVVIDSTAALVPSSVVESDMEDQFMGVQARLISRGLQKLTPLIGKTKTVLMFINQVRNKIGGRVMPGMPPQELPTGGSALSFYSSVRFRVRKKDVIKDGDEVIGYRLCLENKKNKVAPPFRTTEFDLYYSTGIDTVSEIFENVLKTKIMNLEGRTYTYKDYKFVGQDKCKEAIKSDIKLQKELLSELDKYRKMLV